MRYGSMPDLLSALALTLALGLSRQVQAQQASTLPPGQHKSIGVGLMKQGEDPMQVSMVRPGSPAEKAGLKVGDQIVSIAGIAPEELDPDRLHSISDTAAAVAFVVVRDGKTLTLDVKPVYVPGESSGASRVERQ